MSVQSDNTDVGTYTVTREQCDDAGNCASHTVNVKIVLNCAVEEVTMVPANYIAGGGIYLYTEG